MSKRHLIVWAAALTNTIFASIFWHVVLFEQAYLEVGVFTRMDNPIYGFGFAAWLMESTAFVAVYFLTRYANEGVAGGLKLAALMVIFIASSTVLGVAAKTQIADLSLWFGLSIGFLIFHFGLMGSAVGWLNRKLQR